MVKLVKKLAIISHRAIIVTKVKQGRSHHHHQFNHHQDHHLNAINLKVVAISTTTTTTTTLQRSTYFKIVNKEKLKEIQMSLALNYSTRK